MTTVLDQPVQSPPVPGEERFLVTDIRWDFYVAFCNEIGERPLRLMKELWCYNGRRLRFCVLQDDGRYEDQETSRAFSFLKPADLTPFLQRDDSVDETTRIRRFRDWLRPRLP